MLDWEQRAKKLEEKVNILQETLDTVKKMQLSTEMSRYIHSQETVLKLVDLINLISDKPELSVNGQRALLADRKRNKKNLDDEIKLSVMKSEKATQQYACDPRWFGVEIESGIIREHGKKDTHIDSMLPYVGKGVRITSYHGKPNAIIIPEEIEGYPVIAIGKSAFTKMPITDIVLPKTIRAIYDEAFSSCRFLKHIDLPQQLVYLGEHCFSGCGLETISIPHLVEHLPPYAFANCSKLAFVTLNEGVKTVGDTAFLNCPISNIRFPESIEELGGNCFSNTKLSCAILPKGTKRIHPVAFANTVNRNSFSNLVLVVLGKDTSVTPSKHFPNLCGIRMIYCLPGSEIEKHAQEHFIMTKKLSELEEEQ